jgi:hypothetical protein
VGDFIYLLGVEIKADQGAQPLVFLGKVGKTAVQLVKKSRMNFKELLFKNIPDVVADVKLKIGDEGVRLPAYLSGGMQFYLL